ncbi:MAG: hypothetical protein JJU33_03835 [Phycisphaerales bacterium]|nr:hypothetical protein [Phycisphaerales bacterium]
MITPERLPERSRRTLADTLAPGEEILWLARATPRMFTNRTVFPFMFGMLWLSFMLFVATQPSQNPPPPGDIDSPLMFAFFCLVGAGLTSVPLIAWLLGRNTVYAVTDRRALIFEGWPTEKIRTFPAGRIAWQRRDTYFGRADLVFGTEVTSVEINDDNTRDYGFLNIKGAARVEELLGAINTLATENPSEHPGPAPEAASPLTTIPEHLAQRLQAELRPGERVVWRGVPVKRWFSTDSLPAFLVGLFMLAFIGVAVQATLSSQPPGAADPMLVGFVAVFVVMAGAGAVIALSPLGERLRSSNTVYAVTDRRLIEISGSRERHIRSYRPEQLTELTRIDRPGSRGDILIGDEAEIRDIKTQGGQPRGLYNIRNPAHIERLLRDLVNRYNTQPPPTSRPAAPRPITRIIKRYN